MSLKEWLVKKSLAGKLPLWMYRLAGKKIGKLLNLKEDSEMSEELEGKKSWWKSKSILNGIVIVLIGTYETIRISLAPQLGWNIPAIPEFLYVILGAIGIYSRTVATSTIGK